MTVAELLQTAYAHQDAGRIAEAIAAFKQVLALDPKHPDASHELGLLAIQHGRKEIGLPLLKTAADVSPDNYRVQLNFAIALKRFGKYAGSIKPLTRAAALAPLDIEPLKLLGTSLREVGRLEESCEAYRRSLALRPNDADVLNKFGLSLQDQGKLDEAIDHFRRSIALDPTAFRTWSNLLLCLNYHDAVAPQQVADAHKDFGGQFAATSSPPPAPARTPSPDGRIRVGYLSPDFGQHSVAFFIWPVLQKHHRDRVRVTCYSDVRTPDVVTDYLQAMPERWIPVAGMSDEQLAQTILADENDILIELTGHTGANRMSLLAKRKLAPIQATYLGYPNTTGLPTIDYLITDSIADPPGMTESQYSERLVRLPDAFFAYVKPGDFPDVGPTPALSRGHVTFAVLTNYPKVRPPMVELWMRILGEVPNSRLIVQSKSLIDPPTRDALQKSFAARGLADRVVLVGWQDFPQHLQMYKDVDIILDTFPFNGHTTTCHALWMGVPVVTLCGETHRSRMGASVLANLGLHELIAKTPDEYVRIASALAADTARLQQLRSTMRERLTNSVLLNDERFATSIEDAYERMLKDFTPSDTPPAGGSSHPS
jgi:predicted O-linked N-acetylglucosamine transferase (SPINDLY family)